MAMHLVQSEIRNPKSEITVMPSIYHYPHVVSDDEIDAVIGHVNNLAYLKWMQSAAMAHSAAQGWPTEAYQKLGAGWVVRSHQIEYLRPAFSKEEIVVRTWVANFKKVTSLRRYEIVRVAGEQEVVLAKAATDWAFIHFATHQPRRIPPEVFGAFEVFLPS
jgi:acyl-CoA thioester hydrolase